MPAVLYSIRRHVPGDHLPGFAGVARTSTAGSRHPYRIMTELPATAREGHGWPRLPELAGWP